MSKLNGSLYTSDRQDWMTPPEIVNPLLKFEKRTTFDLDPACTVKNIPAVVHYTQPKFDGLALPWDVGLDETLVFINPEYGRDLKFKWAPKIYNESLKAGVKIWALIPARVDAEYQHKYLFRQAGFTIFIYQRLCFWLDGKPYMQLDKKSGKMKPGVAPFPTMLCYFGDDSLEKAQRWILDPPIKGTLMMRYG